MSTRQQHKKSRWGCKRCKAMRMKCDEARPVCGRCLKAEAECDFGILGSIATIPHRNVVSTSKAVSSGPNTEQQFQSSALVLTRHYPTTPNIPAQLNTPPERLLDLRLFHHYIEITSGGYSKSLENHGDQSISESRAVWFNWIVRLSKSSQPLMDVILSLAAFHLRHVKTADRAVIEAGHRYLSRAIEGHSRQLREGINADNAEEVFATSTCLAFHITSGRHVDPDGELDLLHWFTPWQGMKAVLRACWNLIKTEEVKRIVQHEHLVQLSISGGELQPFDFLIDDLSLWEVHPETRTAYETAARCLSKIACSPDDRNILKFPGMMTKCYVNLVSAKDPRALTILGYFFMLIVQLEQVWWLQGAAERDFRLLMKELPEFWKPRMEWASRELEYYERLRQKL